MIQTERVTDLTRRFRFNLLVISGAILSGGGENAGDRFVTTLNRLLGFDEEWCEIIIVECPDFKLEFVATILTGARNFHLIAQ
jgi:hypothetical protein